MSNFYKMTKHPETGKWEYAYWVADYYEKYHHGVVFNSDGSVHDPYKKPLVIEINQEEANLLNENIK